MNSDPLSESTARIGNGIARAMSLSAASTHLPVLSGTERFSVQPVAISVTVSVRVTSSPVAAVVPDQVDLDEPGSGVVPLGPGTHRDLAFEQRSRFGAHTCAGDAWLARRPGGDRWWPPTSTPAVRWCRRLWSALRNDATPPPAHRASAPAVCRLAFPAPSSTPSVP